MRDNRVLIVDDNPTILAALAQLLESEVEKVIGIKSPELIPGILETQEMDVIIMDMNFSKGVTDGMEGIAWLKTILQSDPDAVVVMITAYGEMDLAIEAMKSGATDFISKPWDNEKLVATVRSGIMLKESRIKVRQLKTKQDHLSQTIESGQEKLYGKSPEMRMVMETIRKVAPSDSNVLVQGENGTGKELIAREIHNASDRSGEVFVHVDLGSISQSLFESELFGHTKGAFTDARSGKPIERFVVRLRGPTAWLSPDITTSRGRDSRCPTAHSSSSPLKSGICRSVTSTSGGAAWRALSASRPLSKRRSE